MTNWIQDEEIWSFMRALVLKKKVQVSEENAAPSEVHVPEETALSSDKGKGVLEEEEDVEIMEDEQVQAMIQ